MRFLAHALRVAICCICLAPVTVCPRVYVFIGLCVFVQNDTAPSPTPCPNAPAVGRTYGNTLRELLRLLRNLQSHDQDMTGHAPKEPTDAEREACRCNPAAKDEWERKRRENMEAHNLELVSAQHAPCACIYIYIY